MIIRTTAEIQQQNAEEYRKNLVKLGKSNPEQAKHEATKILIQMGLLEKDGRRKETIVSWE